MWLAARLIELRPIEQQLKIANEEHTMLIQRAANRD